MATKYWKTAAATQTWTTAGNWSTISHTGTDSGGVPTNSDDAVIPGSGVVINVTSATSTCKNLTVLAGSTFTLGGTSTLTVTGNLTLQSNTNVTLSGTLVISTSTAGGVTHTINTAGVTMQCALTLGVATTAGEIFNLISNVIIAPAKTCTHIAGALNLNGYNLSCGIWSSSNTTTRSIAFGTLGSTINITSTLTGTVLTYSTGSNFSYTGRSKFVLSGDVAYGSTITRTITTAGLTNNNQINIFVEDGASFTAAYGTSSSNSDIIAITSGSNILSLDLSYYSGNFLVTPRTINIYGYVVIGYYVKPSGTYSTSFNWTFNYSLVSPPGVSLITFAGIDIGDITINSGNYILDDIIYKSDVFTVTGGTFNLNYDLYCDTVSHTGGTLKIQNYCTLYVVSTYTASGPGTLDLSDPSTPIDFTAIACGKFILTSTSYSILSHEYGSYLVKWPEQIQVTSNSTAISISGSGPYIAGGDVGFICTYAGASTTAVSVIDTSAKFFHKFDVNGAGKLTLNTLYAKGLNTQPSTSVITISSTTQLVIYGDFIANNTFSAGSTSASINLYGSGTSTNPNTLSAVAYTAINYTINSGYYNVDGYIETTGDFVIGAGTTFNSKGVNYIAPNKFVSQGTINHNENLKVILKYVPTYGNVLSLAGTTVNNSTVGNLSGTISIEYDGTTTAYPRYFQITAVPVNAKDALNIVINNYNTGSFDTITFQGNFRDIKTTGHNGGVTFSTTNVYGNLNNTGVGSTSGNIIIKGNDNTSVTGNLQYLGSFVVNKTPGYNVSLDNFNISGASYTIDVLSGTVVLNNTINPTTIPRIMFRTGSTANLGGGTTNILYSFAYETGVTVIPSTSTLVMLGAAVITGTGCSFNNLIVPYTLTLNGNNTVASISLLENSTLYISGNNTIKSISNSSNINDSTTLYLYDNTTTTVTNFLLQGYQTGYLVHITRYNPVGSMPILKKSEGIAIPWGLGANSQISGGSTGATTASSMGINYLDVSGITFINLIGQTGLFLMFF